MALLRNGANRYQFRMKQENELKSLLTDQEFEASDNRELLLAQAKACANGYALATEGIAVVSDFQNKECHIYSGRFGQTIMNLPEYMVDRNSAFEDIVFCHAKEDELIERHVLELRFFNFIKERSIKEKTNFSASCILNFTGPETMKKSRYSIQRDISAVVPTVVFYSVYALTSRTLFPITDKME